MRGRNIIKMSVQITASPFNYIDTKTRHDKKNKYKLTKRVLRLRPGLEGRPVRSAAAGMATRMAAEREDREMETRSLSFPRTSAGRAGPPGPVTKVTPPLARAHHQQHYFNATIVTQRPKYHWRPPAIRSARGARGHRAALGPWAVRPCSRAGRPAGDTTCSRPAGVITLRHAVRVASARPRPLAAPAARVCPLSQVRQHRLVD